MTEAGVLPTGVSFTNQGNGTAILSGVPAAGTGGIYNITITAANGTSPAAIQDFLLKVNDAPHITSAGSVTFPPGESTTFTITTYGFLAASLTENGALPLGVTFTDNGDGTATLSGTPTTTSEGIFGLTITAHNGQGSDAVQNFILTVATVASNSSYFFESSARDTFTVGQSGSFKISTYSESSNPYKLTETGALPSGVTFKDNGDGTATLSGTPGAGTGGTYDLTITASTGPFNSYTQLFVLTVDGPPSITSAASATFFAGQFSTFTVATEGQPYATVTESGALPNGVSLYANTYNGTATLSGTPQPGIVGTYKITFKATNNLGSSTTQNFTLTVEPVPSSAFTFIANQTNQATLTTSMSGTAKLTENGTLPAGVTFTDNGNGTATLSGAPTASSHGTYLFTVTSTASGSSQTQSYILYVDAPPQITSKPDVFFALGSFGSFFFETTGYPLATLTESGICLRGLASIPTAAALPTSKARPRLAPTALTTSQSPRPTALAATLPRNSRCTWASPRPSTMPASPASPSARRVVSPSPPLETRKIPL